MKPTIYVDTHVFNAASGGSRVMHNLAALLHSADVPVACTTECYYNPLIPVRQVEPDDIVVYPDCSPGNRLGAKRICRYMLFYAGAYFGGGMIPKEECCIVYQCPWMSDLLEEVQRHCDYELTANDIICVPCLEPQWLYPEKKTIKNLVYEGKRTCNELPDLESFCMVPHKEDSPNSFYLHQRTLATLRAAKNFYTMDHHTMMIREARMCGCLVYTVHAKDNFRLTTFPLCGQFFMNPKGDKVIGEMFSDRVYKFFDVE